jgi:signal transduction histidine kinase
MAMMKVLVVDACDEARSSVADALTELTNVSILGAVPDVRGAMRALDEGPDVVVTDCDLPDGDCIDVIEAARAQVRPPAIVVFPAEDIPERARRCVAAGADLYVPRAAGLSELQNAVLDVTAGRGGGRRVSATERFELIGRVTSGVMHDLNNYLFALDAALARGNVQMAREASARATALAATVLRYAGGGTPAVEPVDLAALVRRLLDLFGRVIPTNVLVVLELDDVPPVRGVHAELEQLVLNLVLNACEAMPDGGELRLVVDADGPATVRFEVVDTGSGFPEEPIPRTLSRSTKVGRTGNGLGLGIVRSVVDRHGAVFRISPRGGGGTRASVAFTAWPSAAGEA